MFYFVGKAMLFFVNGKILFDKNHIFLNFCIKTCHAGYAMITDSNLFYYG